MTSAYVFSRTRASAAAERGIDVSGRRTKHLSRFARTRFDRVITLCDRVREICPEFPGQPTTAHWSIPDRLWRAKRTRPATRLRRTAYELETRIGLLVAELTAPTEGGKATWSLQTP